MLVGEFLPLYRDAVVVFCSPRRLGQSLPSDGIWYCFERRVELFSFDLSFIHRCSKNEIIFTEIKKKRSGPPSSIRVVDWLIKLPYSPIRLRVDNQFSISYKTLTRG